jgi:hypothetical protein
MIFNKHNIERISICSSNYLAFSFNQIIIHVAINRNVFSLMNKLQQKIFLQKLSKDVLVLHKLSFSIDIAKRLRFGVRFISGSNSIFVQNSSNIDYVFIPV